MLSKGSAASGGKAAASKAQRRRVQPGSLCAQGLVYNTDSAAALALGGLHLHVHSEACAPAGKPGTTK